MSKFLKVRCNKCKNKQIIYSRPSTEVNCLKCGKILTTPKSKKDKINYKVLKEFA